MLRSASGRQISVKPLDLRLLDSDASFSNVSDTVFAYVSECAGSWVSVIDLPRLLGLDDTMVLAATAEWVHISVFEMNDTLVRHAFDPGRH